MVPKRTYFSFSLLLMLINHRHSCNQYDSNVNHFFISMLPPPTSSFDWCGKAIVVFQIWFINSNIFFEKTILSINRIVLITALTPANFVLQNSFLCSNIYRIRIVAGYGHSMLFDWKHVSTREKNDKGKYVYPNADKSSFFH